jgi:hypothetical protein
MSYQCTVRQKKGNRLQILDGMMQGTVFPGLASAWQSMILHYHHNLTFKKENEMKNKSFFIVKINSSTTRIFYVNKTKSKEYDREGSNNYNSKYIKNGRKIRKVKKSSS